MNRAASPTEAPSHEPAGSLTLLLHSPGVGPVVIQRLEEVGVLTVADLLRRGVEPTVEAICSRMGNPSWNNRSEALVRALSAALCRQSKLWRDEGQMSRG